MATCYFYDFYFVRITAKEPALQLFSRELKFAMTLLTAHRILITTAVIFFFGFALWELRNYLDSGNLWALFRSFLYLLVSLGFGLYLRSLKRWYK